METALLKKYNVAAPRYTSYPTVPYWENENFNQEKWFKSLTLAYHQSKAEGISLYIHLPFCESLCTYCGCNTRITKNHAVESPYITSVIKEWEMYCTLLGERPKIKELHLGGGTPTFFSPENLQSLISAIVKEGADEIECSFEGHPANTTLNHLQTLYQLGFKRVSLGIQDFDQKVQHLINRFQTPMQVATLTDQARDIGYHSVNFDLIYGLPGQTPEGLAKTIAAVIQMEPDRIAFYSYAHVPWLKPGQRYYTEKDIPQGDEKFALYQLGRTLLMEAGYQEIGMDHFALKTDSLYQVSEKGQLHRNFMGYTHQHTQILLGLGVSSISDCGGAFAQNAKTVEGYSQQIANGSFAIEKGHILNADDRVISQHILNLMCKNATQFDHEIPAVIKERLQPLLKDQLVELGDQEVVVSALGKSFLRNICMAFDDRLWQKQPTTCLFSTTV
ncbi:oxygen-independent coproporphyrinogen III oxidase [Pedobacter sp. Hv1]|uniref:oxygen-independent coproporphyrinogen III oxidase n=1 Tax=Pedobacter sp. Hv1 TaxID=1740090 RepID=UPI0006D8BDB1|nr:oxygen-independent coproporphyrinogen III oxidase [Pedobacter sp. Hv1]KQC00619.1 coproporphyrinogen III oxidase [Pedobacter sp. Hv1]